MTDSPRYCWHSGRDPSSGQDTAEYHGNIAEILLEIPSSTLTCFQDSLLCNDKLLVFESQLCMVNLCTVCIVDSYLYILSVVYMV